MQARIDAPDLLGLGRVIRQRRRELGLTQHDLGIRLGSVQERISLLEGGKYGLPSLPALGGLARALEVPLASLLGAAGFPVDTAELSGAQRQQLDHVHHLSRECDQLRAELEYSRKRISNLERQVVLVDTVRRQGVERRAQLEGVSTSRRDGADSGRDS